MSYEDGMNGDQYTERDIGNEVFIVREGVAYYDTIVQVTLPDGQTIIGPRLSCGHLYARFVMLDGMMAHSAAAQDMIDDDGVDA